MSLSAVTGARLAATGVDVIWFVVAALVVVALGVGAFLLSRRNR